MRGSSLLAAACLLGLVVAPVQARTFASDGVPTEDAVRAARRSVQAIFGAAAEVVVEAPVVTLGHVVAPITHAVPEPGSRTNRPVRFVLFGESGGRSVRVGRLAATVRVRAPHVRVRDEVAAMAPLDAAQLEAQVGEIGVQPFGPLPTPEQLAGATTRRALPAGTVVTTRTVRMVPSVVVRDEVATIARVDGLEVRSHAVAEQSGHLGDVIWVVNPDSRRRLRGRVVGRGLVEVGHGS